MGNKTRTPRLVKIRNHLPHAGNSSRHAANHVVLIAVVDSHVRISRPDQHRIDSSVALFQIVEIAIDGVAVGDGIIEIAVLHHHLGLEETGLCPLECGEVVA